MNDPRHSTEKSYLSLVEKAADITSEGIVLTDARMPDNPIIYANEGFVRLTGYSKPEIEGKNCRFLQGADTDPDTLTKIREAIREERECVVELLNYRKDGSVFWNRLSITPIRNGDGDVTHFVGVQNDITELKKARNNLEIANIRLEQFYHEVTRELNQAKSAMEFVFPSQMLNTEKVHIASKFVPLSQIGGDFYDVMTVAEGVYGMLIADVSGHGIPAALMSFMAHNAFKTNMEGQRSTQQVLEKTNADLFGHLPEGNFITTFYVIYDSNTKELVFTQAGHPPGLWIRRKKNDVVLLETKNVIAGMFSASDIDYSEKRVQLEAGDKVVLYTDAIIEVCDREDEMFGVERLLQFIEENRQLPIQKLIDRVYDRGLQFSGAKHYQDDVTMVGFEVLA